MKDDFTASRHHPFLSSAFLIIVGLSILVHSLMLYIQHFWSTHLKIDHTVASNGRFDRVFQQFLSDNGYRGGAVAAMKDGSLLVAKGYGIDRAGDEITAHTSFPVSSVAKSLTAVAVMRMVQDGLLSLDEKVFGSSGIIYDVTPFGGRRTDPRLYDVTVDHLLRHTAGWDAEKEPFYDPIFNEIYLKNGHSVPNIAREMNTPTPLDPVELISYIMTLPLAFTPGTQVVYSNFGYLVLGRVIESITDMDYISYVKTSILNPCGMWKTKIYPPSVDRDYDHSIIDSLDPEAVDSTLGWHSNVYDMMRFTRCLFNTNKLLNNRLLEILLARPTIPSTQQKEVFDCAGFRKNNKNSVWQDADIHADDLIVHHNLKQHENLLDTWIQSDSGQAANLPDSWVVLLVDKNIKHIRHYTRQLMAFLEPLGTPRKNENLFLLDLSELHNNPMWELPRSLLVPEFSVQYRVDEHFVTPYVNALKDEGFTVHFLSSLTLAHNGHTTFLIVARRVTTTNRMDSDFLFEHGMDYRKLLKKKMELEALGYNMTLLHSYKSKTHDQQYCFAAVFRYEAFTPNMEMKYGTNHLPEPYEKLVQMYHEKQFYPLSQTVIHHSKDERFSFIFVKRPGSTPVNFKHVHDISAKKLGKVAREYMLKDMPISYMNSYEISGKYKFSVVFSNATYAPGTLELEHSQNRASEITISNLNYRLVPKQMVPYIGEDGEFKVASFYQQL